MPTGFVTRALAAALAGLILALGGCAQDKEAYAHRRYLSSAGPASYLGEPERNTLQMLVDEMNAKGGIKGKPLKAVIYDDEGDTTKARLHAEKLLQKDMALSIIGPSLTHTSMTVLEVTQKAKVPLISCAAGVGITAPAKERVWVFKTPQTDLMAVARIYEYLKKQNLTKVLTRKNL